MTPKQIKVQNKTDLYIKWDDDSESKINLKFLREQCPCATCQGETVLFRSYKPEKKDLDRPEMFQIRSIEPVGSYAIQITWQDGHNTGIYSWIFLKELSENRV
jgi:DUF971 family protein